MGEKLLIYRQELLPDFIFSFNNECMQQSNLWPLDFEKGMLISINLNI